MLDTYVMDEVKEQRMEVIENTRRANFKQALGQRDYKRAESIAQNLEDPIVCYYCTYHLDILAKQPRKAVAVAKRFGRNLVTYLKFVHGIKGSKGKVNKAKRR